MNINLVHLPSVITLRQQILRCFGTSISNKDVVVAGLQIYIPLIPYLGQWFNCW